MSWVIRRDPLSPCYRPNEHHYFTGAGFSIDPRSAIRFTYRHWAEGMLKVLRSPEYKVVRRVRKKRHKCKCACCPCLVRAK